uniref:MerR family transcriptional regulator n=1 Tax=Dysosmobacter sp. TaxID=2591382 RepID=UPI003A94BFF7
MTSKEMEQRSGVPRANIRYYEAQGLLTPQRAKNGYREYSEADLAVLEKIKLLRRLGVSVEELRELRQGTES